MPTFHYANPAVIHWGPGAVRERLLEELGRLAVRRAFLVTTKSAIADPQLAAPVQALLAGRLAGTVVIGQHAPVAEVAAAVEAARAAGADGLVSLGGGSPIDAAKAIAFSLATGLDVRLPDAQARGRKASFTGVLPHLALPTTLSVAELAASAGFSAEGSHEKVGVAAPALRPEVVIYDAELALRTPLPLWLSTGVRAVDHAAETLLAAGEHPLPDVAAEEGLRRLQRGLLGVLARPDDAAARTECQLGAWFSYLLPGPAASGLSHTLGKRLGSPHGIPHGVTSCLVLPHVLRYLAPRAPGPAQRIAAALGASDAASGVFDLVARLGLPQHLAPFGLQEADLARAAKAAASAEHAEADLLAILHAAW